MTTTTQTPVQFFFDHAGSSHDPATETPEQGAARCAAALAKAEKWACDAGCSFEWELDGMDSSEWSDDEPFSPTWACTMRDESGNVVASLCGIDFASGEPWGEPYRRVVQAELAHEAMPE